MNAAGNRIVIGTALETASAVTKELDSGQGFTVKLARDASHLLVECTVTSPTGKESFDDIAFLEGFPLTVEKTPTGFVARASLPLTALGLDSAAGVTLAPGTKLKTDLGYVFGNARGANKAVRRAYLFNNSFSANIVDDIPNESRLEPQEWGEATVE